MGRAASPLHLAVGRRGPERAQAAPVPCCRWLPVHQRFCSTQPWPPLLPTPPQTAGRRRKRALYREGGQTGDLRCKEHVQDSRVVESRGRVVNKSKSCGHSVERGQAWWKWNSQWHHVTAALLDRRLSSKACAPVFSDQIYRAMNAVAAVGGLFCAPALQGSRSCSAQRSRHATQQAAPARRRAVCKPRALGQGEEEQRHACRRQSLRRLRL